MLFITGEDDQLYKADTLTKDAVLFNGSGGTVITTHYRSAPLGISSDKFGIAKFGVWRESNDATGGFDVRFYDEEGDSVLYQYVDSVARRYNKFLVQPNASGYFQMDVQDTTVDSLAYDKFDIWVTPRESRLDE